jgi:hypothetical protein
MMLVFAVFSIFYSVITSASNISKSHSRQEEINGLCRLLGTNLRSLPITATIYYGPYDLVSKTNAVMRICNAPNAFAWGNKPEGKFDVLITILPQKGHGYTLALAKATATTRTINPRDISWLHLVHDIEFLEWRFYDGISQKWQKTWLDASQRPSLVELNLVLSDMPAETIKMVFWLPPVQI